MNSVTSRKGRALRGAGYVLFTAAAFTGFLWWQFPYPELEGYLEAHLQSRGVSVEIDDLGAGPFPGLSAREVRLALPTTPDLAVELGDVRVRAPLMEWIKGDATVWLTARVLGGVVEAEIANTGVGPARLRWSDVDLARLPVAPAYREAGLTGSASGSLDLDRIPDTIARTQGRLEATFRNVQIGPGKALGFPVPSVALGDGVFRVEADKGKVSVREAVFQGGGLGLSLTNGTLLLRSPLERSLVTGSLSLSPGEKVSEDLAFLFAMFPGGRGSDGRYTARVRGNLAAPRLVRR